ncbi:hypothetical protein PMAC_001791 [Pneumocystis sp. 'macacae']|nr:hypothetical protein PMAC_001791 [Pneumocystis sp. 'macacae']
MSEENKYIIHTIIHSPIINFVFCGAFRSPFINDIVLIKEDSVELHELLQNGLTTCISNQPLFSKIRDAKVFKNNKKTCYLENNDIINIDLLVTTNENGYLSFSIYGFNLKKNEYINQNSKNIFQFLNTQNRFYVVEEIKISSQGYNLKNLGYKIALDPLMRSIAIRDALNTVEIFRLNPSNNKNKKFVLERIKGTLSGTIILMDFTKFLENGNFCYLIFYIINYQKKPYITLCKWNTEESLTSIDFSSLISLPLFPDLSIPIYLIPFSNTTGDFSLIFNNKIIYISILQFFSEDSNFEYFDIKHKGVITAYAIDENVYEEDITNVLYLGTDTGDLIYVTVKNKKVSYINVGSIKPIGKVMEIISSLTVSTHLIFISGDMCDNGIYLVHSKSKSDDNIFNEIPKDTNLVLVQSFSNWSPVCDFKILEKDTNFLLNQVQIQNKKSRLFLCSGRAPEGKIAELKTGIKAKITLQVHDFNGIENFWIFRSSKSNSIYIIISFPWQTQLLELTEEGELHDRSDDTQLKQETSTISAGLFNDTYIVQVTQKKIKIFPLPDFKKLNSKVHWLDNTQIVISSSIHNSIITILAKTKDSVIIYIIKLNVTEQSVISLIQMGDPIKITDEPSTMTVVISHINFEYYNSDIYSTSVDKNFSILLLIGTHKPSFIIFEILSTNYISFFDISLEKFTNLPDSIPESSCLIKVSSNLVLLVGLRNGLLLRWTVNHINGNIQLNFLDINIFGSLPLKCVSDSQLSTIYIVGEGIWMVNSHNDTMEIREIILDYQIKTHITLISPFNDPLQESKIRSIACISKETFLIANLDSKESTCVEYVDIKENPRRILYDSNSKLLIVACDLSTLTVHDSVLDKRFQDSCDLKFINLTTGTIVPNNPLFDNETKEYIFDSHETIYALSNWTIFHKNDFYHYIIIGTSINSSFEVSKGNLHILTISYEFEKVNVKRINKMSLNYPVYSISPIGKYGLVFSSGNKIFIKQFDIEAKKFKEFSAKYEFESSVISIKIENNIVYALCQKDSITMLDYDPIKNSLKPIMNDITPRLSLDNFIIENNVFCSDKEKGLVCLRKDHFQKNKNFYLDFLIKLPSSISRFQKIFGEKYYYPFIVGSGIDGSFYSIMSCPKNDFEIYQALISYWLKFSNNNSFMDKEKFSILGESCLDGDFLEAILLYDWDNCVPILSTTILDYLDDNSKKEYILKTIKLLRSAQNDHGVPIKDYCRYRKYCTKKLHRLSKLLGIQRAIKKYADNEMPLLKRNPKYHEFLIISSEKAWAYAMELKTENKNYKKRSLNHQRIVRRLLKAYQYASHLNELMNQELPILRLQALEYVSARKGQLMFEYRQWEQSLASFLEARIILEAIYKNNELQHIKELILSIEQNIRYCAYQQKIPTNDIFGLSQKNISNNELLVSLLTSVNPEILEPKNKFYLSVISQVEWEGHTAPITDVNIAIALSSIQDAYQSMNNEETGTLKEKHQKYNELLQMYSQTENIIKKAIEEYEHFGTHDKTQNLYISYTYVAYNHILEQIKYNMLLISELNSGFIDKNPNQYILCKIVKLYDDILQNLTTMSELPGISNDMYFLQTIEQEKYYFKSHRCLIIAESYFLLSDYRPALTLAIHSYDYLSKISITSNKKIIFINETELVNLKKNIGIKINQFRAFLCLTMEKINNEKDTSLKIPTLMEMIDNYSPKLDLSRLIDFSLKLESLFCKPIFFDIAYNYIDYKENIKQLDTGKGGFLKNFLGK